MPFVGLVSDPRWEPPDDSHEPQRRWNRSWRVPWRLLIWLAAWWGLMMLVPVADHTLGALAGYLLLIFNISLGVWRFERWCSRQYWRGLRDYQS